MRTSTAAQARRPLGRGSRKVLAELLGTNGPGGRTASWLEPATVKTVTAGAAVDGNALVVVTWRGVDVQAAYLSSYTPAVGHTVLLNVQPPAVVIVGRVIGTPA